MTLLTSCWFIVESVIIRDGFQKWISLSFFIHPILLFFCRIFVWLILLQKWLFLLVFPPLRFIFFVGLRIFRSLRHLVFSFLSFSGLVDAEVPVQEIERLETPQICSQNQVVFLQYSWSRVATIERNIKDIEVLDRIELDDQEDDYEEDPPPVLPIDHEDTNLNEDLSSVFSSNSPLKDEYLVEDFSSISSSNSPANDPEMNVYFPSDCCTNLPVMERELVSHGVDDNEESDPFYNKYTERMGWFDVLNNERTCGISAMLNKQLGAPNSFESIEPVDFSIPFMSWSKMSRRKLLRSLESDFEMVYVAQSCLSWEALHHQYRRVEALACSQTGFFYNNVAGKFQKFQVLLERFMEDERCEGKRFTNYARGRFSLKSLLQVPEVSGFVEAEKEGVRGEAMRPREVLKAIEKCIKAFWVFVKTDNKKCWPKFRSLLWTHPPVEDPRDLELLADLSKRLQKKELWMKDLQGKKRCWLKRSMANPLGESQKKEMLFTMIDMKLVSRVLHMSLISSSQLNWCQEKLDNIEFKEGNVIRECTSPLFPSS
ncbi:hypothetical protein VitviT2T_022647 [Vitis vinifera]|uniref:Ribosomal protein L34Ae n=2 Tax=Vitis vinifera TaxID=29760 RepID=A0ABY9DB95_VITVI|nr:uncharacterized protein LOC100266209 [Vitis vinifera]WKA04632.1 hypothetical protein VitviT2T_022647 [Vitis vinifera]|eukprot:XP_002278445.1 PREDICTED: uncharacterized protein LOC100266209 [Vitis vinifera]